MPKVNGKSYPYTEKGKKEARQAEAKKTSAKPKQSVRARFKK